MRVVLWFSTTLVKREIQSMIAYKLFLIFTLNVFADLVSALNYNSSLKLVHIIFRHGERTPTETYKNDPYKEYKWINSWGQLSNRGKRQMYNLGLFYRENYKDFLPEYYIPDDIYISSSYADRCHTSAQLLLAGLYPPFKQQIWNPKLLWQPIPVHEIPRSKDNIIAMKKECPTYESALKEAYRSDRIMQLNEDKKQLYDYLTKYTGQEMRNITAVEFLYNTLEIEMLNNLSLPIWTKKISLEELKEVATESLALFTDTMFMKRVKGGVFLKELISHMIDKQQSKLKPNRILYLYSGHDITLVNVIRSMGFNRLLKPGFGASLVFELYDHNDDFHVKVLYKDTPTDEPQVLLLPTCGTTCTLRSFISMLKSVVPDDWESECLL